MSFLNVPNILSLFRLALVPVFVKVFFSGQENAHFYALLVYGVAALTDVLDGIIARRFHLETRLGKILDPLADKLMTFAVLVSIVWQGTVPSWSAVIFFIIQALLGAGALFMFRKVDDVIPSNYLGKAAAVVFFAVCVILVLFNDLPHNIALLLICAALGLMIAAFFKYLHNFAKVIKNGEVKEKPTDVCK